MGSRTSLVLDGTWTFETDPTGTGEREGWPLRQGFGQAVAVPSPWQLHGPDLVGYTGHAWYHRAFAAPEVGPGRELYLRFDAVDYEATVWLNGTLLGRHEGGYTPFELLVPPGVLLPGENHLVLRAYDPPDNSEIPHGKQGSWYTRVSGPWQPVSVRVRDAVHVVHVHVTPDPQGEAARVRVQAVGPDGAVVAIALTAPDGTPAAHAEASLLAGVAHATLALPAPRLWSPADPALYGCETRVGEDALAVHFGMRWVEAKDGLIHLNGQPLYVRGALDQAFYPETVYRAPTEAAIEREIMLAKQMGLNLLRKHIKLEDPRYLDACDRLGMLIWEEPACCYKYTARAKERFVAEVEGMIARDYNHPSIIAWSLYNEEWGLEWRLWRDSEKQAHVEALFDHATHLDATRLVCDNSGWAHVKTHLNDCHRYFVAPDLLRESEADLARYVETPEINFVAGKQANAPGVPVLVSEFGCWGLPEPSRIERFYGGRPWWFEAQWAGHVEEFKYPATAFRAFERWELAKAFGSLDALAGLCQQRMMQALKPLIEAMRARADLAGYVVTEFTDIEWESNGWLDYFREPKAGFEDFPAFNGETVVMARLERHNLRAGERFEGELVVSNHGPTAFDGVVSWEAAGQAGDVPIAVPAQGNARVPWPGFQVPAVAQAQDATLTLTLRDGARAVATNREALTFSPAAATLTLPPVTLALRGAARRLAPALADAELVDTLTPEVLVLTDRFDPEIRAHVAAGGRALFFAEAGDASPDAGELSFRRLTRGESWDRAASVMYFRPGLFGELPVGPLPGWACEDLYPHHVLALANYMHDFGGRAIELTSNQAGLAAEGVYAGYFEGWLGKFAATIARVPHGRGHVLVTTWRLLEAHGQQPIGDAMVGALIALACG